MRERFMLEALRMTKVNENLEVSEMRLSHA